ncbi:PaaI family thioesterase [Guptibacillus algicola]|uniref:PaaI family thioesterase n=1 Tax=Guptibacillus algicola TaxID=225844 RepID=UPI001CD1E510|nr:PaaI family thioesterase [Alkalihalobacillus algicola]MCA0987945.1 PaaI family thioesterase [Alkalihalobacillus algicola]
MNEQLRSKLTTLLESSDESKQALLSLLEGVEEKHNGNYKTYLAALMGISSRLMNENTYESIIPNRVLVHNPLGITHGGITASLMDIAMGSLVHQFLPKQQAAVTSEMKIHFLSSGTGSELRCLSTAILKSDTRWVVEANVYRDDQKLVATATGTFMIITKKA